jgi:hypothetical protein
MTVWWRKLAGKEKSMRAIIIIIALSILMLTLPAYGQQSYVGRYDVYGGFMYLHTPAINLGEPGFHLQGGVRLTSWVSGGFDYTVGTGNTSLTSNMLVPSLQQRLGAQLGQMAAAGLIPAGYRLSVPTGTRTQSFTMGPQFSYRHFSAVTIFVRPDLGAMQVIATPHPADPIATGIISQLTPSGKKTDWTYYYGFGGGFEVNVAKHFAIRVQADFVHDNMMNDLLPGHNSVRFSIGPGFQWGRNMVE